MMITSVEFSLQDKMLCCVTFGAKPRQQYQL